MVYARERESPMPRSPAEAGRPATPPSGSPATPPGGTPGGSPATRPHASPHRSGWRLLRTVVSVALLGAAAVLVALEHGRVAHSAVRLTDVDGRWVAVAGGAEVASMVVFGRLQQRLLAAGGVRLRLGTTAAITTAADAMTGTLPAGLAWAAVWLYDQLGDRGVPRSVRVWTFLVAGGVSSFALFLVVAAGVEVAGSRGPVSSLRWLAFLLALIPAAVLAVEVLSRWRHGRPLVARAAAAVDRYLPGGHQLLGAMRAVAARLTAVQLGGRGWAEALGLAVANWLLDGVVVVAAMEALGVAVPWRAVLVVYGLTQISASLPLTPGGIGVVAGSLTALLHAYGVPWDSALAVVLLYRLVSFWGLLPVGWGLWAVLDFGGRAGRWREHRSGHRRRSGTRSTMARPDERPLEGGGGVLARTGGADGR